MSLPRRKRLVEVAAERELLVLEDNPYGLLRYEGEPPPTLYSLDGGVYVMYLGTFSKILSPGIRLGWVVAPAAGAGEDQPRQAGGRPLHLHAVAADGAGLLRAGATGATTWTSLTEIYRARRDTMLDALAEHFPPQAEWTRPGGGLFIWATLPDFIDTTDLLARALRDNVAFVPGAAAFLDGRGHNSMRLNFSGSRRGRDPRGHPPDRRGREGAGRPLRHAHRRAAGRRDAGGDAAPRPTTAAATWWSCRAARTATAAGGAVSRVAVLKGGRSLERQVSLRSGARVRGRARAPRPRGGRDRRRRSTWCSGCARTAPDAAFVALHGRDGEDGTVQELLEILGIPYTGSGVLACSRAMDKVLTKHLLLDAGHPDARVLRLQPDRLPRAGRRRGAAGDRGAAGLPDRGEARRARAPRSGSSSPARRRTCPRRWWRPSPTTSACCSSAT